MKHYDEIIIGGGIIGITYAFFLKKLKPETTILIIEKFDQIATESSYPWHNAGTWHGANCELNYTPEVNGDIDISKAVSTHTQAVQTLELLSYLTEHGGVEKPSDIINRTSHMTLVFGEENRDFLYRRQRKMSQHHFFTNMKITQDPSIITQWSPLLMSHRDPNDVMTLTSVENGADINYGSMTNALYQSLLNQDTVDFRFSTTPHQISNNDNVYSLTLNNGEVISSDKLLLAGGGGTLLLLQKLKTSQSKLYAGFPVGGNFLVCRNQGITKQHQAKVYGKASVGAPPMSVPHFDTRVIDGEQYILFGPQATFNPRFLKKGSVFDLLTSVRPSNLLPMISIAFKEFSLLTYLVSETLSGKKQLFKELQTFYPDAHESDWEFHRAGQRVQIIKKDTWYRGDLKLGTEVVIDNDGTLGALLGASPGASVACSVVLELIESLHSNEYDQSWHRKIESIIPSYKKPLATDPSLYTQIRTWTDKTLNL